MISVAEARARVIAAFRPLPSELVMLSDALDRALAEDVTATHDQPPYAVSAMDGYAVRAADLAAGETTLSVIGTAQAGSAYEGMIESGRAVRIFTGAPVPAGADAIALQENATQNGGQVRLRGTVSAGAFVRPRGLDFARGQIGVAAGTQLTPRHLGLCASMNRVWLRVHRRPRVAILGTGDELVLPGGALGPAQIYSSNNVTLAAMLRRFGAEPVDLGTVVDQPQALARAVLDAQGCDLLLTSGGASVGDRDLIRAVLGEHGLDLDFWRIAMRPGKPLIFGRLGDVPLLGLPGNPVSSAVCCLLFARAAIRVMQGFDPSLPIVTGRLGIDLAANDKREDYLRAQLEVAEDGRTTVTPYPRQDSSMFALFTGAQALVIRAPYAEALRAGAPVPIVPLRPIGLDV